jgi:pimeloyl-ACP methyl ester carboxylesterase
MLYVNRISKSAYQSLSALIAIAWLTLFGFMAAAHAENVQQSLPDGKALNAEYRPGDVRRPAILVLPGFLQTHDFTATQSIINSSAALGYAILGPNLSLGVPDRQQSMQCEAPHKHTFEDDLSEIDFWVKWLLKTGHPSVIIVGHSWGSQHGVGYVEAYPQAPVSAVIAISLVRTREDAKTFSRQVTAARARAKRHDQSLQPYALSFCNTFMATPQSYLSYARWDDKHVVDTLVRLRARKFPVYVVIGSEDNRSDNKWVQTVRRHVTQVAVIQGANHFFSSVHEFDLSDQIEAILTKLNAPVSK